MKNGLDANPIHEFFGLFLIESSREDAPFLSLGAKGGGVDDYGAGAKG